MSRALDEAEKRLLRVLQHNAGLSVDELAAQTALSNSSVHRKIRKLEQDGIIEKYVAVLSADKLDSFLTIITLVEMISDRPDSLAKFRAKIKAEEYVQQCQYVTGESDFVLISVLPDMAAYDALCQRLFSEDSQVKKFRTIVSLRREKFSTSLPL